MAADEEKRIQPRFEQFEELTRGVQLPLPVIEHQILEVLAERLYAAYIDIRSTYPDVIKQGNEPEITALLQARLNRLIDEDTLWRLLVNWVGRGVESISFNGSHLEKRPDLSIVLSGKERRLPLIVEAKIIDAKSSRTIRKYCQCGLRRFVDGEYAWGNQEAFMIGYVRDGSTIEGKLTPYLIREDQSDPHSLRLLNLPAQVGSSELDLARSSHQREFVYVSQEAVNAPGPIAIWHLWLS